jgi:hypothetical protein
MSNSIKNFLLHKAIDYSGLYFIPPCITNKSNVDSKGSKQRNRKMLTPVFGNLTE